ncbi:MAG: MATE family efflux transporter [Bacteroidia bacterium]|nr:MATE family efflux transporter [Bacteroidia bacterium]
MQLSRYYNRSIVSSLIKLGAPVVAGNIGLVLMGLIDNAMVGELGYLPLAAAGISNTVYFIATIFGIGVLMVFSANIAAEQTKDRPKTESLIGASLFINWLVALFTFGVLLLLHHFFEVFQQTEAINAEARPYFRIVACSVFPMFLYLTLKSVADGHNLTKAAMNATFLALGLNAFLNWVLIFGNLGFKAYGLVGAGYATLIGRCFMAIYVLVYCIRKPEIRFKISTFWTRLYRKHILTLLKLGIPSGGQFFFEVSAFAGAAIMAGWIGEKDLAAHTIAIQLASITYMFGSGLGVAGMIKTGETWAQKKYKKTLEIGRNTTALVSAFMALFALVFVVFRVPLVRIFSDDAMVIEIASNLMILAALFQFFDGLQAVSLGLLRGMNDTKIPSLITLVVYWAIALPAAYILGIVWKLDMVGIWIALTLALILASLFLYRRFLTLSKERITS